MTEDAERIQKIISPNKARLTRWHAALEWAKDASKGNQDCVTALSEIQQFLKHIRENETRY